MSSKTEVRLTPGQRFTRGLKYTAVGPVDVTRGAVGLGVHGAHSAAARVRHSVDKSGLAKEFAAAQDAIEHELAVAQEVLANLPSVIADVRKPKRHRRRTLVFVGAGVLAIAGGAVAFSIVRRSTQPEPSSLPPSVDVTPRP